MPNVRTQPQPPERDVACNNDVRVSMIGQLPGAAAVGQSGLQKAASCATRQNQQQHSCRSSRKERRSSKPMNCYRPSVRHDLNIVCRSCMSLSHNASWRWR